MSVPTIMPTLPLEGLWGFPLLLFTMLCIYNSCPLITLIYFNWRLLLLLLFFFYSHSCLLHDFKRTPRCSCLSPRYEVLNRVCWQAVASAEHSTLLWARHVVHTQLLPCLLPSWCCTAPKTSLVGAPWSFLHDKGAHEKHITQCLLEGTCSSTCTTKVSDLLVLFVHTT